MPDSDSLRAPASAPAWGRYGELRPTEIEAIRARSPIAYVPWGALEWHCHHAPIGLDSTKAEGICFALAKETGGVVLPAIPFGVNTIKPFKGFPHSLDISSKLASDVAEELCGQLADEQFRVVILFTGHYPPEQIDALEAGAERARQKTDGSRFLVWADNQLLDPKYRGDHAGATETSFQMLFVDGSVKLDALPDRPLTLDGDGVMGEDPRQASAERGRDQLAGLLKNAVPQVQSLLREMGAQA